MPKIRLGEYVIWGASVISVDSENGTSDGITEVIEQRGLVISFDSDVVILRKGDINKFQILVVPRNRIIRSDGMGVPLPDMTDRN